MSEEQTPPESQRPPLTAEQMRELYYLNRRDAERAMDDHREFVQTINKGAMESANLALRMAILINGGAAISLLAFVGGMVGQGRIIVGPQLSALAFSLVWFGFGVAVGTFATGVAYFTNLMIIWHANTQTLSWQYPYVADNSLSKRRAVIAECLRWVAATLAIGSLILFVVGMIDVYRAVARLG